MKKIICLLGVFIAINANGFASLPPLWQDVRELKAILDAKEFGDYLHSGEAIQDIKKTDNGWAIHTNQHIVNIQVNYQTKAQPGPARFILEFQNPQSTSN